MFCHFCAMLTNVNKNILLASYCSSPPSGSNQSNMGLFTRSKSYIIIINVRKRKFHVIFARGNKSCKKHETFVPGNKSSWVRKFHNSITKKHMRHIETQCTEFIRNVSDHTLSTLDESLNLTNPKPRE